MTGAPSYHFLGQRPVNHLRKGGGDCFWRAYDKCFTALPTGVAIKAEWLFYLSKTVFTVIVSTLELTYVRKQRPQSNRICFSFVSGS